MSLELIYTSVPRGLSPGSNGFCTAAATGGMSRQVVTKLESLSGYQFHFNLSDPRAAENPVNWAHTQVRIGAETQSVLSRIAYCGADYSNRSNKIAHHFLLEHGEQSPNGPAWMLMAMAENQALVAGYGGEPRNLPKRDLRTLLPAEDRPSEPATTWQAMTGDAGWAGVLAKAFRENPKVPAFVIFAPGQELLPLFEEALALLPPQERWQVGFATYYTALPAGCQYHWLGIIAGSSAAKEMQRFPNATVIDLTAALGRAPENMFTQAARTGAVLPPVRAPERPKIKILERAPQPVPPAAEVAREADDLAWATEAERHGPAVDPRELAPSPAQLRSLIRRARWVKPLLVGNIALVASVVVLAILLLTSKPPDTPTPDKPPASPATQHGEGAAVPSTPPAPVLPSGQGGKGDESQPQTTQADNSGSKPAAVEPPKEPATQVEAGASSKGGQETRGSSESQPMPQPPPAPDQPSVEQEVRVEPKPADRDALIKEGYEFRLVQPQVANEGLTRKWNLGESSSFRFLDMPASIRRRRDNLLEPIQMVPEGSTHRLDIKVPSAGGGGIGGPTLLLSSRLKGDRKSRWLEAELGQGVTQESYGDYLKWLVIEVADDARHIYQCRLDLDGPKKDSRTLGYSNNGPLSVRPICFQYPWHDILALRVGTEDWQPPQMMGYKQFEWTIPVSGDADGHKEPVIIRLRVDVALPNISKGAKSASQAKSTSSVPQGEISVMPTLKQVETHIADELAEGAESWRWYQTELEQRRRLLQNKESSKEDKDNAEKFLKESKPPESAKKADGNIRKFMGAAELAMREHGHIQIRDAWGISVFTIELKYQKWNPEDLFKNLPK